jgi:hypothetical protein
VLAVTVVLTLTDVTGATEPRSGSFAPIGDQSPEVVLDSLPLAIPTALSATAVVRMQFVHHAHSRQTRWTAAIDYRRDPRNHRRLCNPE